MSTRSTPPAADLGALHRQYRDTGDPAIRDELVVSYQGLARSLAMRFERRGEALDDLTQVALLALVKAVDRFDPDRGVQFSTFAWSTIVGELKRHLRDKTWAMRVPRRVQERLLAITRCTEELAHRLGRQPSVAEVAEHLELSEEVVIEALEANRAYRVVALEALEAAPGAGPGTAEVPVVEPGLADAEGRDEVRSLLARLPERQAEIVRLRFYEELTQAEIGARLGISQMHVSRLLARSLEVLRTLAEPT